MEAVGKDITTISATLGLLPDPDANRRVPTVSAFLDAASRPARSAPPTPPPPVPAGR